MYCDVLCIDGPVPRPPTTPWYPAPLPQAPAPLRPVPLFHRGRGPLALHTLYTLYIHSIHNLYTIFKHPIYILYTFCIHSMYILNTSYIHYVYSIYTFYIHFIHTVHTTYPHHRGEGELIFEHAYYMLPWLTTSCSPPPQVGRVVPWPWGGGGVGGTGPYMYIYKDILLRELHVTYCYILLFTVIYCYVLLYTVIHMMFWIRVGIQV